MSTPSTNGITTIAFDFGGVLVHRIGEEFICHMAHAAGADPQRFSPALWRHRNAFDAGDIDAAGYWRLVMDDAGIDAVERSNETETIDLLTHLDALGWSSVRPGMMRWIAALRAARFRCLIISNMAVETYDLVIRHAPFVTYFEHVVLSGALRINKPDRRIFETAVSEMGVDPGEILFLDDLLPNVEGARAAGLQAIQFNDPVSFARDLTDRYPEIPRTGLVCP